MAKRAESSPKSLSCKFDSFRDRSKMFSLLFLYLIFFLKATKSFEKHYRMLIRRVCRLLYNPEFGAIVSETSLIVFGVEHHKKLMKDAKVFVRVQSLEV